jgi:hypothetical protein
LKDRPDQDDEQLSQQHHHMWNVLTFTSRKVEVVISTLLRKKTVNVLKQGSKIPSTYSSREKSPSFGLSSNLKCTTYKQQESVFQKRQHSGRRDHQTTISM